MTCSTRPRRRGAVVRRLTCGVLLSAAAALSLIAPASAARTPYPGGVWEPGPARFGSTIVDEVPVTMSDGVILRASVAYPTDLVTGQRARGRFPVVVEHTPYVRFAAPITPIAYLAEHGYITVVIRARGTGSSGGEVQFFGQRERQDGKAIVEWAAHRLEGADGRVALIGCSYPGIIAIADAATVGPNSPLKAVVASCNGLGDGVQREAFMMGGLPTGGFHDFTRRGATLMGNAPAAIAFFNQLGADVMAGGDPAYDRAFWRERSTSRLAPNVVDNGLPILLWSGWRDINETGTLRTYAAFQNAYAGRPVDAPMNRKQRATSRYQLIIGGWAHAQGLDMGVYLQWLETWLKGADTGIQKTKTPMPDFRSS